MAADALPHEQSISLLQRLIPQAMDSTTRSVIIAAAGAESWRLIDSRSSAAQSLDAKTEKIWLASLLPYWCQQLNSENSKANDDLRRNLQQHVHHDLAKSSARAQVWADAIAKLPSQAIANRFFECWLPEDRSVWQETISKAIDQTGMEPAEQESRATWLRFANSKQRHDWLDRVLATSASGTNQMATIEACLWADAKATTSALLDRFSGMTPRLQEPVLLALVSHPVAVIDLVDAIESKRVSIPQITATVRQRMSSHPKTEIRKRFAKLFESTEPTDLQLKEVIESYRVVLQRTSEKLPDTTSLERGKASFQKNCATCHRIGQDGQDVGPPLKSLHEKSPEQLLISILDPNREVDPRFQAYSVLVDDGRVLTGVIREESANQIVLAESGGKLTTIARAEVEQVKGNGYSLMPQGLQQQLTPDALAELIAWLRNVQTHPMDAFQR